MRFTGRGHPAIRATHAKTLELTPATEITPRATCVVAVGVPTVAGPMAGDVRITLSVGAEAFSLDARANPLWDPAGPAVIRRSPFRLPGTFATHATAGANGLPRSLVDRLRDPAAVVTAAVERVSGRTCVVLFALQAGSATPDAPLRAELAAADLVIAEDADAARVTGAHVATGPQEVAGRVLVVAGRELPGRTVAAALGRVDVETVGLLPPLAAAAASSSRAPVLFAAPDDDPRAVLRDAHRARVVLAVSAGDVGAVLAHAAAVRPGAGGVLVQAGAPPRRVHPDAPVQLWSNDPVYLCVEPVLGDAALAPNVAAAIDALLTGGVGTRVAAQALAELAGWPRRRAYGYVLRRHEALGVELSAELSAELGAAGPE